jgi:Tfp pilus assembly protein PilF
MAQALTKTKKNDPAAQATALSEQGLAALRAGRAEDALALFDQALALAPNSPVLHFNRGVAFKLLGRPHDEISAYIQALALQPRFAEALNSRGSAIQALDWLDEALADYDRALAVRPDYIDALINRSVVLKEMHRFGEAQAVADRTLALAPDNPEAHWNVAMCALMLGDYPRGFREYEWRWRRPPLNRVDWGFAQPLWRGEELAGRTLLLHAEQGFGDTIQFCRYAPLAAARGARVVIEVQQPLKTLLASLEGVSDVVARGEPLPHFDFHAPMMSLPLPFGTTLDTIPAGVPYLGAPLARYDAWRARLSHFPGPKIGIVWSGNRNHKNNRHRSIALTCMTPLFELGFTFVSLQKEPRDEDRWLLSRYNVLDFADVLDDFAETAALISALDAVVTVDTSVAHLAGALGKRTLILVPYIGLDWRWLPEGDRNPWYPSMRLFRQPAPGEWDGAVRALSLALPV